jgi:hypothetical protein
MRQPRLRRSTLIIERRQSIRIPSCVPEIGNQDAAPWPQHAHDRQGRTAAAPRSGHGVRAHVA